jgi:hypothetical protein
VLRVSEEDVTGLVIPVRDADRIVRPRALELGQPWIPRAGTPVAHITLLTPFLAERDVKAGVLDELDGYFADVTSFGFALTEVCEFPDGTTYLSPEPADVFRRLTVGLHRLFPECPPYGGVFDDVVPHLSVPLREDEDASRLRTNLRRTLPLNVLAVEAQLLQLRDGEAEVLATFPFGSTAA